ncbi:MAG: type I pullulanase [Actinobacteria bacterium]|nr:type I pullulanase [Actinomycetota bacterium]
MLRTLRSIGFVGLVLVLLAACASPTPVTSATPTPTQSSDATTELTQEKTLIVHYLRYDGEYEPWNLWLWPEGAEGAVYEFTEEDEFGVVARATVPGTADVGTVGIIVRTNDWAKDVPEDRFVTEFDADGVAEIWLIQGESEIYYQEPETGPKFLGASIDSLREISITTNEKVDTASVAEGYIYVVSQDGAVLPGTLSSKFVNPVSSELVITLEEDLDLGQSYQVASEYFGSRALVPGRVFGSEAFAELYHFDGELGPIYSRTGTTLRVWAPTASDVNLLIYKSTEGGLDMRIPMTRGRNGTWEHRLSGDQHLTVYNYEVFFGTRKTEAVDPYVYAAAINGQRGVIVDLARTNPVGWRAQRAPFSGNPTDAVIYELHVRDLGMNEASGISNPGKFVSLTEEGTGTAQNPTGIDAIAEMGITHLQLIPIYDYASIDETRNDQFNWGYDPLNYNVPEGSYSTDAYDPVNRILELKTAIKYLNERGIRVIMDVVYNHVYDVTTHSFQKIVPGYYFRTNPDGSWANGTGVGNEVASERSMVQKFIVESATYWAKEYGLGGFRFDLMGIHDVETMNQIRAEMTKIDPTFIIIGEGWNMGNILDSELKANQLNAYQMPGISHFNDGIRDGIKGSVFNSEDLSRIHRFASSIALLAQGVAFIHAGQEFERSKDGDENSYKSPDSTNALRWAERAKHQVSVDYFKGLIELRKEHPAFRMRTASAVKRNLEFFGPTSVIAYELDGKAAGDSWSKIVVVHNPGEAAVSVNLPTGEWNIAVQGDKAGTKTLGKATGTASVGAQSTMVLFQD